MLFFVKCCQIVAKEKRRFTRFNTLLNLLSKKALLVIQQMVQHVFAELRNFFEALSSVFRLQGGPETF